MFALGKGPRVFLPLGMPPCSNHVERPRARGAEAIVIKRAVGLLAGLLLAGCQQLLLDAAHPQIGASTMAMRHGRENAMNTEWQNHTLSQLVAARGQPK